MITLEWGNQVIGRLPYEWTISKLTHVQNFKVQDGGVKERHASKVAILNQIEMQITFFR